MARENPYLNFRFRVDGIDVASFADVTVPETSTTATDYREGTDPTHSRKLSGLTTYGTVSLKRGLTDNMDLYNWRKEVIADGALTHRKDLTLVLVDEAGNDAMTWQVLKAWPTKYDAGDFSAKGNDVIIESLDLVCEEVKQEK